VEVFLDVLEYSAELRSGQFVSTSARRRLRGWKVSEQVHGDNLCLGACKASDIPRGFGNRTIRTILGVREPGPTRLDGDRLSADISLLGGRALFAKSTVFPGGTHRCGRMRVG
jgi:hypothetical protein